MTSTMWMRSMFAVAALVVASTACAQWSFQLDTTFRTQILHQNVNSLLVLPDGKLIASGIMRFPGEMSDKRLVRLNTDGIRDESFYNSGLGGTELKPWQGDTFYVRPGNIVRRILPNGVVDPSFIGMNSGPYFNSLQGGDYHVFPDGRVLLSGAHTLSDSIRGFVGQYNLVWFTNTGYLDTTRVHRQANGVIRAFTELPDGKFLCSCTCTQYEGQPVSRLFRIHADGSLDTTFNAGVNWGNIYAYHPLPDGRVYVGGRYKRAAVPNDTLYLARFMPDGSLDGTFQPPQLSPEWLPNPGTGALATFICPWRGDNLILTGRFLSVNGSPRSGVCILDSTGLLYDAFDGCGVAPWTYQGFTYVSVEDIKAQGPDTLYVCGAYVGFDECTINDPDQRFVSRLLVTELTVGVEQPGVEEPAAAAFGVYPNPARDQVVLRYDLGEQVKDTRAVLRDATGRIVATIPLDGAAGQKVYDPAQLTPGIYLVQFFSDAGLAGSIPLVIQR